MNRFVVKKSGLKGETRVPTSKSQTLRACLFGTLAKGKSRIYNYLPSNDTAAMVEACRLMGAKIDVFPDRIEIEGIDGKIDCVEDVIQAHNSGIVLRFCTAIGALAEKPVVVTGDQSIRHHRPMKELLKGLSQLGVRVETMRGDGFAPVIIQGPIKPGKIEISGEDSQPVSALLIASSMAKGPVEIVVKNAGEKPWVHMTLEWLERLGISCEHAGYERYWLQGKGRFKGFDYTVPSDFSSAAFPIAAALVTQSEITLKNMDMNDSQGDKELVRVFQKMGAEIEINPEKKTLSVKRGNPLKGLKVDINDFIDAITILAVVACKAEGETHIYNASVAKQKECNRIQAIVEELKKMGADIQETVDGLIIRQSKLIGTEVFSHNDHRMAMSLAVAGMMAEGDTVIDSVDCVSKTFPTFIEDFSNLSAHIKHI